MNVCSRLYCLFAAPALALGLGAVAVCAAPPSGPPDAADAAMARDVARSLRDLLVSEGSAGQWSASETELNAALVSAGRVTPEFSGHVEIAPEGVTFEGDARAEALPGAPVVAFSMSVAASEDGLKIASARLGGVPMPASLVAPLARAALDRWLGDGLGTLAWHGIRSVDTTEGVLTIAFDFADADRMALFERLRTRVREIAGEGIEPVYAHLWWLDHAGDAGELPRDGSFLPYLHYTVAKAAELSEDDAAAQLAAALSALTLYCGDPTFGQAIGVTLKDDMRGADNHCEDTTLQGRDDLKRHFVISAGLAAARGARSAVGVGELKELLDSNPGGSGFSFDDMAANAAGVRFARAFLDTPRAQWDAMLAEIGREDDLMPDIDGLAAGMDEAAFRRDFGDIDSPVYRETLAEIDRRIDALPLYGGVRSN